MRRGVVFINETVPGKLVAIVANYLYKEHYVFIPTQHDWKSNGKEKQMKFDRKIEKEWNSIYENKKPDSVMLAEGSPVSVKWKRNRI